ncbi:MAG: hypothetical protein ACRDT4_25030 [Micromonosporaceae bacterium]
MTDNGDGTLTILVLVTGNEVLYRMDGKAIARNPGQVRFELLIGHNGTPADLFDDKIWRSWASSGNRRDGATTFCAASVAALS